MAAAVSRLSANIPNLLSFARLGLAPAGIWLVLESHFVAAFWVLIVAGVSDAVDGIIARWANAQTRLGALLDPVADKALLAGMILSLGLVGALPIWLVGLVVVRDAIILVGASYLYLHGVPWRDLAPTLIGKASTLIQIVLAGTVLARLAFGWPLDLPVTVLVWLAGAAAAMSGVGYIWRGRRQLRPEEPSL